jgi:hypothetical protein
MHQTTETNCFGYSSANLDFVALGMEEVHKPEQVLDSKISVPHDLGLDSPNIQSRHK